jgi:cephalosporin hydroxylase
MVNSLVRDFHRHFYDSAVWCETFWFGAQTLKNPLDMWIYQEIIHQTRPELIVETGTWRGGSAWFLASMLDVIGQGQILTIDIAEVPNRPQHPRIRYLTGSSVDPSVLATVQEAASKSASTMVLLDSDHSYQHVIQELRCYHGLVTPRNYLIVEDTNINGNPVLPTFGPGPHEAVTEFLRTNNQFFVDRLQEKFMVTQNPGGFLLRI